MNNNDIYKMNQQRNLYSINRPVPIANLNYYPSPLINANIVPNVYGTLQNPNKNVAQIGYNQAVPNANRIKAKYNPINRAPSTNMKNPIVLINNMNIIQTQQMNKNNANIFPIGNNNLINQRYNPSIQSTNLINFGYNPVEKSNINITHQKSIQMTNNNKLPYPNMNTKSNNEIKSNKKDEVSTGHKQINIYIALKAMKSICKIIVYYNNETNFGTGFFMKISNSLKYLITNYHVLNPKLINKSIQIELYNKKVIILNLNEYEVKYMEKPKDITAIKLKDSDDKFKDIEYLGCDLTYLQYGYEIYNNIDAFSGNDSKFASGKIFNINNYEFDHNIDTYAGSSGCPIILNNNNNNLLLVIGIHKNGNKNIKINGGTFIGELINEINKDFNNNIRNIIIAEIFIKDEDVYNNISIINSYEKWIRIHLLDDTIKEEYKNEKEIKECEIKINDELIPFNYFHKFKNYLTNINYMFFGCSSLTNINLSIFNTQNVTNMEFMFSECSSLTNINLSNFNTQNVTNMEWMFFECSSLTNINLSNFNTQNVTNMEGMFSRCSSLKNVITKDNGIIKELNYIE